MMYMSRAWICETTKACRLAIEGEYAAHKAVWDLFGDKPDRKRDFLYRVSERGSGNLAAAEFLLVSKRKPLPMPGWKIETKEYDPVLSLGNVLEFQLRVNPVRTIRNPKGVKKRVDIVMDAKKRLKDKGKEYEIHYPTLIQKTAWDWLEARQEKMGIEVNPARMTADSYRIQDFRKHDNGTQRNVRFATLDISGICLVREPDKLKEVLFQGYGPAKGFGCGLMLVRRS